MNLRVGDEIESRCCCCCSRAERDGRGMVPAGNDGVPSSSCLILGIVVPSPSPSPSILPFAAALLCDVGLFITS